MLLFPVKLTGLALTVLAIPLTDVAVVLGKRLPLFAGGAVFLSILVLPRFL